MNWDRLTVVWFAIFTCSIVWRLGSAFADWATPRIKGWLYGRAYAVHLWRLRRKARRLRSYGPPPPDHPNCRCTLNPGTFDAEGKWVPVNDKRMRGE